MCFYFYTQPVNNSGIAHQPFFNHPDQTLFFR
ncbi:protein YjeV [Salmonella enterica subsp. enterica serovar Typhimurium var. monophasic 4,5,12:i:-]|nr:protein YjeV [Salmonella enterica subsp. enterica serovar Typhimurium var. monophasic 4,5,12:i:-]